MQTDDVYSDCSRMSRDTDAERSLHRWSTDDDLQLESKPRRKNDADRGCHLRETERVGGTVQGLRWKGSDVDSVSSVAPKCSTVSADMPSDVKQVYRELNDISHELKRELQLVNSRKATVKEKEILVAETQRSLETLIAAEVRTRLAAREQETDRIKEQLLEKIKENKRMKENFDTLKTANDSLHKELESLKQAHDKLYKQHCSLQARITNLQRRDERKENVRTELERIRQTVLPAAETLLPPPAPAAAAGRSKPKVTKTFAAVLEVLGTLFEWVSASLRRYALSHDVEAPNHCSQFNSDVHDRCLKILPHVLDVLRQSTSSVLPCLEFIYWSLMHFEMATPGQQLRPVLPSTIRRLGDELYSGGKSTGSQHGTNTTATGATTATSPAEARSSHFMSSPHLQTRLVSCLILLKSINRVDNVAHVLNVLATDLQSDSARQLFYHYRATGSILAYIRPANKTLTNAAVDLLLQLSVESSNGATASELVAVCSSAECLQKLSLLWLSATAEPELLEKTSILLEKLSRVKCNRRYFDMYGITSACSEILRMHGNQSPFLALNVRSLLQNVGVAVTTGK